MSDALILLTIAVGESNWHISPPDVTLHLTTIMWCHREGVCIFFFNVSCPSSSVKLKFRHCCLRSGNHGKQTPGRRHGNNLVSACHSSFPPRHSFAVWASPGVANVHTLGSESRVPTVTQSMSGLNSANPGQIMHLTHVADNCICQLLYEKKQKKLTSLSTLYRAVRCSKRCKKQQKQSKTEATIGFFFLFVRIFWKSQDLQFSTFVINPLTLTPWKKDLCAVFLHF